MSGKARGLKLPASIGAILGMALMLLGFLGNKMAADNVKLTGWLSDLLKGNGTGLMIAGGAVILICVIIGNWAEMGQLKLGYFFPYLLVIPTLVFLILFVLYPMLHLVYLSLFTGNVMNPTKAFVGLKNYNTIFFVKKDFLNALQNTAVYTAAVVVLLIFFAVVFALWMYKDRKINRFAQTAFFTPHLIASVTVAFVFQWLMDENAYGLFNTILMTFGLPKLRWLNSSDTAMASIIFVNVWKSIGYYALVVLAALKSIPTEIYEAAELDNTPKIKCFFKITLPLLSPQLFFLLITITIGSFKVFDTINIMTAGGPGGATEVVTRYIYDYAFIRTNTLGIGATAGVVLMVVLMLLTLVYFRGLERKVHYQ